MELVPAWGIMQTIAWSSTPARDAINPAHELNPGEGTEETTP